MDELLKELEVLSEHKKDEFLKQAIKSKKKELSYLVAKKNCYHKQNNLSQIEKTREDIKCLGKEISYLQQLKNQLDDNKKSESRSNVKPKVEKKVEIVLTEREIDILKEITGDDKFFDLTHFETITIPLLEHLLLLKQDYQFHLKYENKIIKKIRRSISILNDLATPSKKLNQSLEEHQERRKAILKVTHYLDALIHLEYKKINKINREEKRLTETLFAERYGIKEILLDTLYKIEELYSVYYQLVFRDRDLQYVEKLLEEFPDLFVLKTKKRLFYQDILDRYENILLNKNYMGTTKKELDTQKEIEYYQNLIIKYLSYAFENNQYQIVSITVKKIERILELLDKNELYVQKSKVILEQLSYLKEMIQLSNMSASQNTDISEIKGEYIFSIDNDSTKIIEDALSIQKKGNDFYINFYTPDVISFVEPSSVLDKKAYERFKNCGRKNYALTKDTARMFQFIQGRKKRVVGYHFVLDEDGNLKDLSIEKHIAKLYNAYSFEEFNELLIEGQDKNAQVIKELYCILEGKDNKEFIHSSNILKSLLLSCGTILGKYLAVKNIPCIYKNLDDGTLSSIPTSDYYVEFSSPLRSYLSIMNQRILLNGRQAKNIEEQCIELNQSKQKSKMQTRGLL